MKEQYSLLELNNRIKEALIETIPSTVWVVGEISELKENRNGHCYLELVEKEGSSIIARSRATIWSYTYRMLKPYFESSTGQLFSQGIKVLVQATVEFHPVYGLSLNIRDIDPTYTLGDMAIQRKEIIERLKKDGIFGMNKELKLPLVPQRIAVISSGTAAGYQDFMDQLQNNVYGIRFYTQLFEAYMQGSETVSSVIDALERIFAYDDFFDAVAIIRGGGATADLSSFDDYDLAANIAQFPLPVVTGIGHEKDDTVIDMVAHTRLKTPTAVAEFFVNGAARFYEFLLDAEQRVCDRTREILESRAMDLERSAERLRFNVGRFIAQNELELAKKGGDLQRVINRYVYHRRKELERRGYDVRSAVSMWQVDMKAKLETVQRTLKRDVGENVTGQQIRLAHLADRLVAASRRRMMKEQQRVTLNENVVRLLDPENVLRRGFTLSMKDGQIIKSVQQIQPGDVVDTIFADGKISGKIIKKEE